MKAVPPRDFTCGEVACHWHAQPADTLGAARAWLSALGGLGEEAGAGLVRDPRGRPRLPDGHGDIGWSHAGNRILLAHVGCGRIGVDVETTDRRVDALRLARRWFDPGELVLLEGLGTVAPRARAFLLLWCAKEAVLKAHGHGIGFGLSRVALEVDAKLDAVSVLRCDPALGDHARWRLHAFEPEPGYLAVVAHYDGILPA